jgi:hypothetical protein
VLEATAACLPSANVIVVAPDAVPVEGAASWNAFIASVESLLADAYTCRSEETGRICVRSK